MYSVAVNGNVAKQSKDISQLIVIFLSHPALPSFSSSVDLGF